MNSINDIIFQEGSVHTVTMTIPDTIPLVGKQASIQVRNRPDSGLDFQFYTDTTKEGDGILGISGQVITLFIPADVSLGKADTYMWQLKIYSTDDDAINSAVFDFIILPSINI